MHPLGAKLSWSHYRELLTVKDVNAIRYYIDICEKRYLSKRELRFLIKSGEYERLTEEAKQKLIKSECLELADQVPDPIFIRSNKVSEEISEFALKEWILNNLDSFLFQLGSGFSYVGNEYKIKIGERYNYIDILLFNMEFNSYVVVELKTIELKKEHIGQIQVYMNYVDCNLRKIGQDRTIGIIICKQDNEYVIKYCSDKRIISREYKLLSIM